MTKEAISKHLTTQFFGKNILCFDSLDSTNTYLKTSASQKFDEGSVVVAEEQTAGRGRFDRSWLSSPGENLTFSVLIRPKISPENIGVLSLYTCVSVTEAIKGFSPDILPTCKWPNDIFISGKKCCGILCEGIFSGGNLTGVVIGVGLNVNQRVFPSTIASSATSLALVCGRTFDREVILACVLEKLEHFYSHIQRGDLESIIHRWQQNTAMFGKEIIVDNHGDQLQGIAKTLDTDGGLIITIEGVEKKVLAGKVTIVR